MQSQNEQQYRLRLAQGFLSEAQQDCELRRWRSCVDNSQLAVENAAKLGLATLGPVGHTHNPAALLRQAVSQGRFAPPIVPDIVRLAECAELLGPELHSESDYGDESTGRTPWELFGETDARRALSLAEQAVVVAGALNDRVVRSK